MENLLWILPLLVCPLGMLLMGAAVWLAAKLGLSRSEPSKDAADRREQDARSTAALEAG
jgi:hypothetical protein